MNWSRTFGSAPASDSRIASWMRLWLRLRMNCRTTSFLKSPGLQLLVELRRGRLALVGGERPGERRVAHVEADRVGLEREDASSSRAARRRAASCRPSSRGRRPRSSAPSRSGPRRPRRLPSATSAATAMDRCMTVPLIDPMWPDYSTGARRPEGLSRPGECHPERHRRVVIPRSTVRVGVLSSRGARSRRATRDPPAPVHFRARFPEGPAVLYFSLVAAPVAQLDRASASGAEGYRFEPYRAYQSNQQLSDSAALGWVAEEGTGARHCAPRAAARALPCASYNDEDSPCPHMRSAL